MTLGAGAEMAPVDFGLEAGAWLRVSWFGGCGYNIKDMMIVRVTLLIKCNCVHFFHIGFVLFCQCLIIWGFHCFGILHTCAN